MVLNKSKLKFFLKLHKGYARLDNQVPFKSLTPINIVKSDSTLECERICTLNQECALFFMAPFGCIFFDSNALGKYQNAPRVISYVKQFT